MVDDDKKELKVISGDGEDLTISPVYEHIKSDNIEKEDDKKKKDYIIPKRNSNKEKNQ